MAKVIRQFNSSLFSTGSLHTALKFFPFNARTCFSPVNGEFRRPNKNNLQWFAGPLNLFAVLRFLSTVCVFYWKDFHRVLFQKILAFAYWNSAFGSQTKKRNPDAGLDFLKPYLSMMVGKPVISKKNMLIQNMYKLLKVPI